MLTSAESTFSSESSSSFVQLLGEHLIQGRTFSPPLQPERIVSMATRCLFFPAWTHAYVLYESGPPVAPYWPPGRGGGVGGGDRRRWSAAVGPL